MDRARRTHCAEEKFLQNVMGKSERKRSLGHLGVDGMIVLKYILKKYCVKLWTRFICLRIGFFGWSL
jgi:hypothetical protein